MGTFLRSHYSASHTYFTEMLSGFIVFFSLTNLRGRHCRKGYHSPMVSEETGSDMLLTWPTPYCFVQNSMLGKEYKTHHFKKQLSLLNPYEHIIKAHRECLVPHDNLAFQLQFSPCLPPTAWVSASLESKGGFNREQIFCFPLLSLSALPVRPILPKAHMLLNNPSVQISKNLKNKYCEWATALG